LLIGLTRVFYLVSSNSSDDDSSADEDDISHDSSSSESEDEDEPRKLNSSVTQENEILSSFMQLRADNIKRNNDVLTEMGIVPTQEKRQKIKKAVETPPSRESESESSSEECNFPFIYVPYSEAQRNEIDSSFFLPNVGKIFVDR
jgi:hypothetical protein